MKKNFILLIFIVLILSCNKNDTLNESFNKNLHLRTEQFQGYTDSELNLLLNTAAISLLEDMKNPSFAKKIFDKAKKECSGDYEVLFKFINDSIDNNFKNNFVSKVNTNKSRIIYNNDVEMLVGNYPRQFSTDFSVRDKVIEGDVHEKKYFTQVFIPFLEKFSSTDMPKAIVVYSLDGTDNKEYFGYEITKSGDFITKMISEDYAKNNLVWVVSINENIESDSSYLDYILCKDTISTNNPVNGDTLTPRDHPCKEYYVTDIYLKEDLEDWVSGRSDVWFILAFMDYNGYEAVNSTTGRIAKVKQKYLNEWISVGTKEMTVTPDNVCREFESIDFIIYEQDVNKVSWQREFRPWRGIGTEFGRKTYYYSSKQSNFFSRTFPECGRWYHELPYLIAPTLDRVWDFDGYAGYSKTSSSYNPF